MREKEQEVPEGPHALDVHLVVLKAGVHLMAVQRQAPGGDPHPRPTVIGPPSGPPGVKPRDRWTGNTIPTAILTTEMPPTNNVPPPNEVTSPRDLTSVAQITPPLFFSLTVLPGR